MHTTREIAHQSSTLPALQQAETTLHTANISEAVTRPKLSCNTFITNDIKHRVKYTTLKRSLDIIRYITYVDRYIHYVLTLLVHLLLYF